jgi:hypothetical protein
MGFADVKPPTTAKGGFKAVKPDLNTVQGLYNYAQSVGLGEQAKAIVEPPRKLSFLQRLGAGLSAFNPAEAILTGEERGLGAGIKTYGTGILKGLGSAITGTDYAGERRYFADVAERFGIKDGTAKFGIGFLGDIFLDPSTYFGGAIAKGVTKGAGAGAQLALRTVGKAAPETETALRALGTSVQDAFGRAFVAGYKSSPGAREGVLTFLNERSNKLIQAASDQLSTLGVEGLSKEQRFEVGLKAALGKQAEFLVGEKLGSREAATQMIRTAQKTGDYSAIAKIDSELASRLTPKFDTPGQATYFSKLQERSLEFAKQAGIEDPYAVYMPFIRKEAVDGFVRDIQAKGIRVGSEDYLKQFKNILTTENIELDPIKSFFKREAQVITDVENRKFLEGFVEQYGKPLDALTEAEAKELGFKILREKGGLGKALGYVPAWDAKLLTDLITPEFQTVNMLAKATGFDALTNLFKRSVTGLFLPFHVRNYLSGMIQNYEALGVAAINPKIVAAGQRMAYLIASGKSPASEIVEYAGKKFSSKEVFDSFSKRFSGDTFYNNEFLEAVESGSTLRQAEKAFSKESLKRTLGFQKGNLIPILGSDATPFKSARAVGQFIEHQQKASAYLAALSQGKNIPEALKLAERAGFDYRSLTAFESQILRRILPFYSFTRKNIELQLRTLGENPERINHILSLFRNIGEQPTEEEKKNLPKYLADSLGIKLADLPNGIKQYISSLGTPIEQFAQLFNNNPILYQISTMNPLLKAPVEIGIGKDSFRQRDLKDVYDASEYSDMPKVVKDMLDIVEVKKDILEKQPNGKLKKVGERTQYVADPVKLLIARSLFTSRGITYLDQAFGNDLKGFVKVLKLSTGIKPQQIDLQMQESIIESQKKRELEDMLKKYGKAAVYSKAYVPKK